MLRAPKAGGGATRPPSELDRMIGSLGGFGGILSRRIRKKVTLIRVLRMATTTSKKVLVQLQLPLETHSLQLDFPSGLARPGIFKSQDPYSMWTRFKL